MEIPKKHLLILSQRLRFFINTLVYHKYSYYKCKRLKTSDILNNTTIQAMYTIDIALIYINFLLSFFS